MVEYQNDRVIHAGPGNFLVLRLVLVDSRVQGVGKPLVAQNL